MLNGEDGDDGDDEDGNDNVDDGDGDVAGDHDDDVDDDDNDADEEGKRRLISIDKTGAARLSINLPPRLLFHRIFYHDDDDDDDYDQDHDHDHDHDDCGIMMMVVMMMIGPEKSKQMRKYHLCTAKLVLLQRNEVFMWNILYLIHLYLYLNLGDQEW